MFVIGVVRALNELYNVRCSVRTVLVRSRNTDSREVVTVVVSSFTGHLGN